MHRIAASLVLSLVVVVAALSGADRKLELSHPVDAAIVEQREVVSAEKFRSLMDPDYDVWYQGTWDQWHLFSYRGGFTFGDTTSTHPMYQGTFRCSAAGVTIREADLVDLRKSGATNAFSTRRVLRVSSDDAALDLDEPVSALIRRELEKEKERGANKSVDPTPGYAPRNSGSQSQD